MLDEFVKINLYTEEEEVVKQRRIWIFDDTLSRDFDFFLLHTFWISFIN